MKLILRLDRSCYPKPKSVEFMTLGECVSEKKVNHDICVGSCPSFEELDPFTGETIAKECSCCSPEETYTESIVMLCRNKETGRVERKLTPHIRIRSCRCAACGVQIRKDSTWL